MASAALSGAAAGFRGGALFAVPGIPVVVTALEAIFGAVLVGIDALSIGADDEAGDFIHRTLLGAGIWILETLDLSQVSPGHYDLVCLPLKIVGADGAPARAVLRPR